MEQFAHFAFRCCQGFAAEGSGAVKTAQRFAVALFRGPEIAFLFEPFEQRIEAAGAELADLSELRRFDCGGLFFQRLTLLFQFVRHFARVDQKMVGG